jgi:transposase InsO family protein
LGDHRVLICDRDRKWSQAVRQLLADAGVHVVQTPFQAPNANAHAERFVRSVKHECLDRIVPLGSVTFDGCLRNSSFTTTASEITKGSGIGSSKAARCVDASEGFAGVSDLVAC